MDAVPSSAAPSSPEQYLSSAGDLGTRLPCRIRGRAGSLLHSGVSIQAFYLMHALAATVPLVAGITLFGWRAVASVGIVIGSAVVAFFAWRNIGARGRQMELAQILWLALLLGLMLPPHLASAQPLPSMTSAFTSPPWPILASAGFGVVILHWLISGFGTGRFHAALAVFLILVAVFWSMLTPHWVLARKHVGAGDLLLAPSPGLLAPSPEAWLDKLAQPDLDAFWQQPASQWLTMYTRGVIPVDRGRMPLHELLRDRMPPLEDLVVGGHPGPVGSASVIAVIVGGLFMLYRGLIDFRIPLLIVITMYLALLILPIPTVITERGAYFRWLSMREPDVRWETAVTFVNYQLTASPAIFMAFFLATAPSLRPFARRARAVYAVLIGLTAAAAQLYISVSIGPYLALLGVGLLAPILDRWFAPRTLV